MRRTTSYVLLVATIVACLVVWCRGGFWLIDGATQKRVLESAGRSPAMSAAAEEGERVLSNALNLVDDALVKSKSPSGLEAPNSSRSRDGCDWGKNKVSTCDLCGEFLMPPVTMEQIVRHKTFNGADVPLCPWEMEELKRILDRYNECVTPVIKAYRGIRTAELVDLIERGAIEQWKGPPASDGDVAKYAAMLVKRGVPKDEAAKQADRMRNQMSAPQASNIKHNGKYYLMPPASVLPESKRYYDCYKALVLERMQEVVAWFMVNGFLVDQAELMRVFTTISSVPIE